MKFLLASTNIKMSPHTGAGRTPSKIWSGAQTYLGTDRSGDLGEDVKTISSRPTPPPAQHGKVVQVPDSAQCWLLHQTHIDCDSKVQSIWPSICSKSNCQIYLILNCYLKLSQCSESSKVDIRFHVQEEKITTKIFCYLMI